MRSFDWKEGAVRELVGKTPKGERVFRLPHQPHLHWKEDFAETFYSQTQFEDAELDMNLFYKQSQKVNGAQPSHLAPTLREEDIDYLAAILAAHRSGYLLNSLSSRQSRLEDAVGRLRSAGVSSERQFSLERYLIEYLLQSQASTIVLAIEQRARREDALVHLRRAHEEYSALRSLLEGSSFFSLVYCDIVASVERSLRLLDHVLAYVPTATQMVLPFAGDGKVQTTRGDHHPVFVTEAMRSLTAYRQQLGKRESREQVGTF